MIIYITIIISIHINLSNGVSKSRYGQNSLVKKDDKLEVRLKICFLFSFLHFLKINFYFPGEKVIKVFKPSHPSHICHLETASSEYEKAPETFFSVSQDRHARSEGMRPHRARQNRCQDLNIGDDMKIKVVHEQRGDGGLT